MFPEKKMVCVITRPSSGERGEAAQTLAMVTHGRLEFLSETGVFGRTSMPFGLEQLGRGGVHAVEDTVVAVASTWEAAERALETHFRNAAMRVENADKERARTAAKKAALTELPGYHHQVSTTIDFSAVDLDDDGTASRTRFRMEGDEPSVEGEVETKKQQAHAPQRSVDDAAYIQGVEAMNVQKIHEEIDKIYDDSQALRKEQVAAHQAKYASLGAEEQCRLKTPEQFQRDVRRDQINDRINSIVLKNQVCSAAQALMVRETEEKRSALLDTQPDIQTQLLQLLTQLITTMAETEKRLGERDPTDD